MSQSGPRLSADEIRGLALSSLGLLPDTLETLNNEVFWAAIEAHNKEQEMMMRHQGELIRGAALRLFNLQLKKKDQITDPRKFWLMPWDEPDRDADEVQRLASLSQEERENEVNKLFDKLGLSRDGERSTQP